MKRIHQLWVLAGLLLVTIATAAWLNGHAPTVNGHPLSQIELTTPLSKLKPAEYDAFYSWLGIDYGFMLVYTVFYTWALRWLAADERFPRLALAGRMLSWITAVAIIFDATENMILWADASLATLQVSPWLVVLVKLKWLSTVIFVAYATIWLLRQWFPRALVRKLTPES